MEHLQTLPTDEDVKWDKLLDNILKSADAILWGASPATTTQAIIKEELQPLPTSPTAAEPQVVVDLLPLGSGQEPLTDGQPVDVEDEFANVLDDFWLPDYLGGQPGSINIQDQKNVTVMPTHESVNQPLLRLKSEVMSGAASSDSIDPPSDASLSIDSSSSQSQYCGYSQQDLDRPYVKKPPNAFMLFRKEQSPNVVAQFNITNSAVVNKILGKMWKSLPKKLQAKYYQQAEEHKILHSLQHPDWSCTENYGKKRKRDRSRNSTSNSSKLCDRRSTSGTYEQMACCYPNPCKEAVEDVSPAVERCCSAMSQASGEELSCHHYHKNLVGETHTYAHTRGC
ncbi:sex-determining region Y protein-like isoform X2 [Corythoichthys intestinalis]|uniref:sex-determining region Y protein-like isoform X2 n=1 Tax=Corythoichthys intestinalis TaxID=161448 RepID=UPI0025A4D13B|nr:sex-determining region Y protein-like isoform X2 [Corythoichthys intestinalis]